MREIHKDKGLNGYDHNNQKFPYHIGSEVLDGSRAEIETIRDGNGELASVLLDGVEYIISTTGYTIDRLGNTLAFHAGSGRTRVEVRDVHARTIDGQEISNVVLIRTELSKGGDGAPWVGYHEHDGLTGSTGV